MKRKNKLNITVTSNVPSQEAVFSFVNNVQSWYNVRNISQNDELFFEDSDGIEKDAA